MFETCVVCPSRPSCYGEYSSLNACADRGSNEYYFLAERLLKSSCQTVTGHSGLSQLQTVFNCSVLVYAPSKDLYDIKLTPESEIKRARRCTHNTDAAPAGDTQHFSKSVSSLARPGLQFVQDLHVLRHHPL